MSYQITLLTPDNSFLEALFISNSLYQELIRITRIFDLEHLDLAFLREIKNRAIATCSSQIKTNDPVIASAIAFIALVWFDELVVLIDAIKKLPQPNSIFIHLD